MNRMRAIRQKLGLSQTSLARALGCSQGNVSLYERGQTVRPEVARRLIALAAARGMQLGFEDIYGAAALTEAAPSEAQPSEVTE